MIIINKNSSKLQQQGNDIVAIVDSQMNTPPEQSVLETVNNRIYFYSDIEIQNILKLNKEIRQMGVSLLHESQIQDREVAPIFLHINSRGGSIFDGFSAMDAILNSVVPVYTIVDGCCASAATLLSIVGKKRYIQTHSYMLIHQLSGIMWGNYERLKDESENYKAFMDMVVDVYEEYTKIKKSELKNMLKRDLWWPAEKCISLGLCDSIL